MTIIRHNGVLICRMYDQCTTDTSEVEVTANARLIAAAPEMLDALEEALLWLDLTWDGDYHSCGRRRVRKVIYAAIAKAKGV